MGQPQLQSGHFYLVHDGKGHSEIRAYMHDGWYPAEPHPVGMVCEMSRTHHPDNVSLEWDDIVVTELDQIVIEKYFPAASTNSEIAEDLRGVRGMAQALCIAAGQEWDPNWTLDLEATPDPVDNHHVAFLMMACSIFNDAGGDNPTVEDIGNVIKVSGKPLGIFRPRKWPVELQPGAIPLPYESDETEGDPAAA